MIGRLVTQGPPWRLLPRWLGLALANAFLMEGVRLMSRVRLAESGGAAPEFGAHLMAATVLWMPLVIFLMIVAFRPRCGEWVLALPVRARTVWRAHALGLALASLLLLLAAAVAVELYGALMLEGTGRAPLPGPGILAVLPAAAACALPAAALLAARGAGRSRLVATPGNLALAAAVVTGALAATAALGRGPAAALAAPVAVAALVAWRVERRLPEALELGAGRHGAAPAAAGERAGPREAAAPAPPVRRPGALVAATAFRVLQLSGATWITLPVLLFYGALISGSFFVVFGDEAERHGYFTLFGLLTVYLLLTPLIKQMRVLHLLDPLPIGRRRLFAVAVAPGLAATALGYALTEIAGAASGKGPDVAASAAWHPFVALLVGGPYLLLAAATLRLYAPGVGERARTVGAVALQAVAVGSAILVLGLAIRKQFDAAAATLALRRAADAVAEAAPGGAATVWLLAVTLLAVAWRVAEARFERAEAPLGRQGRCLIESD